MGEGYEKWAWLIFIPIVIFIITAVSNGANLTDGIDGLAAGTSAISVLALGIFTFVSGNIIFSSYLNIMYIPNSGEMTVFHRCICWCINRISLVQFLSRIRFYGRYRKFDNWWNYCGFGNFCSKRIVDSFVVRNFSGRKFISSNAGKLFQIYQENVLAKAEGFS